MKIAGRGIACCTKIKKTAVKQAIKNFPEQYGAVRKINFYALSFSWYLKRMQENLPVDE